MGRKCFSLVAKENIKPSFITDDFIKINEYDGKGYCDKAHLSTIDALTTKYSCKEEMLENNLKFQNTYLLNNGKVFIPTMDVFIVNKIKNEYNKRPAVYKEDRYLTKFLSNDCVNISLENPYFQKFCNKFVYTIKNYDEFYKKIMTGNFDDHFKTHLDNYLNLNSPFHRDIFLDRLSNYTISRDIYLETKKFVKEKSL